MVIWLILRSMGREYGGREAFERDADSGLPCKVMV